MGLLGVPVRTASNVKEELAGLIFAEALENDVFRGKLGSSLRELVAGVGIQAEVVSLGLTLQINKKPKRSRTQTTRNRGNISYRMDTITLSSLP